MKKLTIFLNILIICSIIKIENSHSVSQNKIIAKVESQLISSYELKNKIKTLLFLSNQELNQENINLAKSEALRSLINYKLKKQEVSKFRIPIEKNSGVDNYLKNMSLKYNTDLNGLRNIFNNEKIDFEIYINEIMTEFAWQKLIIQIYRGKINIDENEINEELKKVLKNQKNVNEYNLAEIEIFFDNDNSNIKNIYDQIKKNGFESTAIKFSNSTSSIDGGKIGWINSNVLSTEVLLLLNKLKPGDISEPLIKSNTATIFKLIDKKTVNVSDLNLKKIKKNITSKKQNDLLKLYSNSYLSKIKNNAFIQLK